MMDIEIIGKSLGCIPEIGVWLEKTMPNPPLPEPQRWTFGHSEDGRIGVRFISERDALRFIMRWGG